MFDVRRLMAAGTVLGLGAVFTCSLVWGEPARDKAHDGLSGKDPVPAADRRSADDLAASRFADKQLVTYQGAKDAPELFALLVKPKLDAAPARPLDLAVVIDVSASKAQGPLVEAQQLTAALAAGLGADDHIAVWTISTQVHDLTRGFQSG